MSTRIEFQNSPVPASFCALDHGRWRRLVAGGVVASLLGAQALMPPQAYAAASPTAASAMALPRQPAGFADLVERVQPAVVSIATTARLARAGNSGDKGFALPDLPDDSPFSEFFRRFFDGRNVPNGPGAWRDEMRGLGSGFIIDPSGYVVTNNHVVKDAEDITVVLADGSRYPAELKGRDSKTDLALLKVNADRPLPYVELGDSDVTRVGDWVVAVGNPFGLGGSVTAGIVSARGRDINAGPFDDYIQIDAPINQGNSGGPLFGLDGRVVGVNTAIYSPSGGNVGIGFAIPANQARPVLAQLKSDGRVARGWLGVRIQQVSEEVAESLGIPQEMGVLIAGVDEQSPAARAGLRAGDLILRFDGKPLNDFRDLPRLVAATEAGSRVDLRILRQGKERTLKVKIGSMPQSDVVALTAQDHAGDASLQLGLQVATLDAEARRKHGIPEDVGGVLVVGVDPGSPAAKAGIRAGNVVTMVGQEPVASPEDLMERVKRISTEERPSVLLLVTNGDEQRFVVVKFKAA